MGSALKLVQAVADILGLTGDEKRAAELVTAWGDARHRAGLEEAARICDDREQKCYAEPDTAHNPMWCYRADEAGCCASEIRAHQEG